MQQGADNRAAGELEGQRSAAKIWGGAPIFHALQHAKTGRYTPSRLDYSIHKSAVECEHLAGGVGRVAGQIRDRRRDLLRPPEPPQRDLPCQHVQRLLPQHLHHLRIDDPGRDAIDPYPARRKLRRVAGTAYEGTYIHKKDGYYYFFASIGTCCEGLKSTYTTVVGRSKKLFGPYVDKNGKKMLDNHHEILIHKNEAFVGTGHNSEIVTDKAGNDWVFYHAVSTKNPGGRVLMLDKVDWKDGWPSVSGNSPSSESERPVL